MLSYNMRPVMTPVPQRGDGLADLWRSVVRHKTLLGAVTGTCCAAGVLYVLLATPQYRAEALLRVQSKAGTSISALSDVSGSMAADASASDESDVLTSRSVVSAAIAATGAETVVETQSHFPLIGNYLASRHATDNELAPALFGLDQYAWGGERLKPGVFTVPEAALKAKFHVVAGQGGRWTLYDKDDNALAQGRVGETVPFQVDTPEGRAPGELRIDMLRARPGVSFELRKYSQQTTFDNVLARLRTAIPPRDSTLRDPALIRLSYQAESPLVAQGMVNAIIKTYQERDVERRAAQAQTSLGFLKKRLPALKSDLEAAENRLNTFRTQTGTVDIAQQNTALITRMSRLEEQQTNLQLALDAAQHRFQPGNENYQSALTQLNQVKHEIAETSKIASNLPTVQRQYVELARDVAVTTQLYTSVLTNAQQLEVAAASTPPGIAVVDWAVAPEKQSWPRGWIVLLGSIFGGLFVSTVSIYLIALNRKELRSPEEIDHFSQLPRLAVIARSTAQLKQDVRALTHNAAPAKLLAMTSPTDPSIEALRSLRSSVRAMLSGAPVPMNHLGLGGMNPFNQINGMPFNGTTTVMNPSYVADANQPGGKVILFTGPTQGVGKSFVSSNFAYLLAETRASVLLIDADMRQGRLRHLVDGRTGPGLAEVLEGTARVDEAIVPLGNGGLSIMDAGAAYPENPAELLGRPAFQETLTMLRDIYDYIVIDSPPVLPVSDALSIAMQNCDLVLLVSRADRTGARQLEETLRRLENVGAKVGGHVFNGFAPGRYGAREEYGFRAVAR
ncbi:polysaccharide biosynthesis tyrosine autokinase [Caballeronia concitans]|uniref:non-specific protein-tyrosine kinase n=1 Tax=Caballeronia concitans TaxID=1777133 RepID=A0A658QYF6_9BURK|nr:polysaccharide biosynthesis tyrosine autokinase [Caballeronia concitans]KIG11372.1 capsular exopolysaccharide family [Burkholderia sp. MR1]SAL32653.1 EPS transport-related membrane protein kinase [Caballeronia concitans]